jgi:serine/threonine-protein kinase
MGPVDADPRIGARYGAYTLERRLGEGGMGMVYVGVHARTGREYAVKLLQPLASAAAAQAKARFEREARALCELRHANVVAIHDFDVAERGEPYIVMDLLDGEPLADRIARTRGLPWPDAVRVFSEIASALAALHDAGVVHRDVKPSNVLLARVPGGEERAVLVDFGIAKDLAGESTTLTAPDTTLGTPAYMPPEQARGQRVDERADVYALGVVLYECAAGRPPFVGPTPTAVIAQTLVDPPPPLTSVAPGPLPEGIDAVIGKALAKDPNDRWRSVRELADAVAALGGGRSSARSVPATRTMPAAERAPVPASDGRTRIALGVVAGVVVLGALAWAIGGLGPTEPEPSRPWAGAPTSAEPPMQPVGPAIDRATDAGTAIAARQLDDAIARAGEGGAPPSTATGDAGVSAAAVAALGSRRPQVRRPRPPPAQPTPPPPVAPPPVARAPLSDDPLDRARDAAGRRAWRECARRSTSS